MKQALGALLRYLAEFVVFVVMWAWLMVVLGIGVGVLAVDGLRYLWPQVPGIVMADGDRVSYALRGREFTADLHRLPAAGTPVTVYVNPLAPAIATRDVRPAILDVDETWVPVVLFGGAGLTVVGVLMWWAGRHNPAIRNTNEFAFMVVSLFVVPLGFLTVVFLLLGTVVALWPTGNPPDWSLLRFAVRGMVGLAAVVAVLGWWGPYPNYRVWFEKMWELIKES